MQTIPIFYFPATILCVDDDRNLLNVLNDKLVSLDYKVKVVTDPNEAINVIKNTPSIINNNFLNNLTNSHDYEGLDVTNSSVFEFKLSPILDIINNPNRFNELGVIIIDYLMPKINGIELCRQIKDNLAKKILLTGEADDSKAVAAFNCGLINCYIQKAGDTTIAKVVSYVDMLTKQYFIDKTATMTNYLENLGLTSLSDEKFVKFFEEVLAKENIREYYLIDKSGSFLLINAKNEKIILLVHNNNSLNELIELFDQEPQVTAMVESMKQRQRIPFFGLGKNPANVPLNEWKNCFYDARLLEGKQQYYWSLIF